MTASRKSRKGGARPGAGRPSEGKKTYAVSLTKKNAEAAKKLAPNFSGLLDQFLSKWLKKNG